jgi:hypothetical protein
VKHILQLFQCKTFSEISLADMACAPKFLNRFSRNKTSACPSGVCQAEKLPGINVHVKGGKRYDVREIDDGIQKRLGDLFEDSQ